MATKYFDAAVTEISQRAFVLAETEASLSAKTAEMAEILKSRHSSRDKFAAWSEYEEFIKGYAAGYYRRQTGKQATDLWIQGVWEKKQADRTVRKGDLDLRAYETARVQFLKVLALAFPLPKREGGGGTRGVNIPKFIAAVSGNDAELASAFRWALDNPDALRAAYKAAQQAAAKRPKRKVANG